MFSPRLRILSSNLLFVIEAFGFYEIGSLQFFPFTNYVDFFSTCTSLSQTTSTMSNLDEAFQILFYNYNHCSPSLHYLPLPAFLNAAWSMYNLKLGMYGPPRALISGKALAPAPPAPTPNLDAPVAATAAAAVPPHPKLRNLLLGRRLLLVYLGRSAHQDVIHRPTSQMNQHLRRTQKPRIHKRTMILPLRMQNLRMMLHLQQKSPMIDHRISRILLSWLRYPQMIQHSPKTQSALMRVLFVDGTATTSLAIVQTASTIAGGLEATVYPGINEGGTNTT